MRWSAACGGRPRASSATRPSAKRSGRSPRATQVTAAAGYPLYHRHVAQLLQRSGGALPWQRVVGAGGEIKLKFEAGLEQRMRLKMEGVRFRGKRVDMAEHQHRFKTWEFD